MTKQLYVIAAVCLWLLSACQSSTYKYEAVYKDRPFDMPRIPAVANRLSPDVIWKM